MSVLKYFKNTPRSPPIGRQALSVIFFLQIRNEVPGKKKALSPPPNGRQPLSPHPWGDRGLSPVGGRQALFINPNRHSLCHLSPKIQEKSWSACRVVTSF